MSRLEAQLHSLEQELPPRNVPARIESWEDLTFGIVPTNGHVKHTWSSTTNAWDAGMFVPEPDPARGEWFNRDIAGIAAARGLGAVAPYLIEADAVPGQTTWPRGGQLRVDLPNNHLQYAFTWFGLAACLIGVFSVFAWRRLHDSAEPRAA